MRKSKGSNKLTEEAQELEPGNDMDDGLQILAYLIAHHHIKKTLGEKVSKILQVQSKGKKKRGNK